MDDNASDGIPADAVADGFACWRCGLTVAIGSAACPHCGAMLKSTQSAPESSDKSAPTSEYLLNLLFCTYLILLATGILHAFILRNVVDAKDIENHTFRSTAFACLSVAEAIDTVIIAIALWKARGLKSRIQPRRQTRILAWILALPALAMLLALNLGYHALLRNMLQVPLLTDHLMTKFDLIAVLTICVQPAFAEEAYCRWFTLDSLRGPLGTHAAVWITGLMFGFLHVAMFSSIPYLIVFGACLAYLRLMSGTLWLPIMLHFSHNLIILLIGCIGF